MHHLRTINKLFENVNLVNLERYNFSWAGLMKTVLKIVKPLSGSWAFTKLSKLASPPVQLLVFSLILKDINELTTADIKEIMRYRRELRLHQDLYDHLIENYERSYNLNLGSLVYFTPSILWSEILYIIMRKLKPSIVLETGTDWGFSSSFILQALEDNQMGNLYSIDFYQGDQQSGWIIPQKLRHRWHIISGKSSDHLFPTLKKLGSIDVFLHDSLHTYENMLWEYETAWPFIRKGGLLLSHDIPLNNAFSDFSERIIHKPVIVGGRVNPLAFTLKPGGIMKTASHFKMHTLQDST
jgi:predicted O-methyltransferase YrrM